MKKKPNIAKRYAIRYASISNTSVRKIKIEFLWIEKTSYKVQVIKMNIQFLKVSVTETFISKNSSIQLQQISFIANIGPLPLSTCVYKTKYSSS